MKHFLVALVGSLLLGLAPLAYGDGREPGSLLVFPIFNSVDGAASVVTVTNINGDTSIDPSSRLMGGTIDVEYIYIDSETCEEFNRTERLTPKDTLAVIANAHNPNQSLGYLYVFAKDPLSGEPITFDWLIGQNQVIDGILSLQYGVNVFVFEGRTDEGMPTDVDEDRIRDLDGTEYEQAPDELLFPRFMGQGVGFDSSLVLINLTGGTQFTTTLDFLIYNDNEYAFSSEYTFRCWDIVPLVEISGVFRDDFLKLTDNSPREIRGLENVEAGWFRVDGGIANSGIRSFEDPAFLGFLTEFIGPFGGADLPFQQGVQDNGDLLPRSVHGDL